MAKKKPGILQGILERLSTYGHHGTRIARYISEIGTKISSELPGVAWSEGP